MLNIIRCLVLGWFAVVVSAPFAHAMTNQECRDSGGACMPVVSGGDAPCGMCLHSLSVDPRRVTGPAAVRVKEKGSLRTKSNQTASQSKANAQKAGAGVGATKHLCSDGTIQWICGKAHGGSAK